MEPEAAFGQVLRGIRKRQRLSQEQLALEAGLERNYVSLLELGRNSASVRTVFKLAEALSVPASEFMAQVEAKVNEAKEASQRK